MKSKNFFMLLLSAVAVSACAKGAPSPVLKSSGSAVDIPAATTEQSTTDDAITTPKPTAGLQKLTYQLGPFALRAKTTAEAMREKPARIRFAVDEALWVTGFVPRLENAAGEALPGALLHFAMIANQTEANPLCTTEHTGNPLMAATGALKEIRLPAGYGYAVLPEDSLEATVVLQNPTDQDYHEVYFTFTVEGTPMAASHMMKDVMPLLLDTDPCHHEPLSVEPGAYVKKIERFAVPETGSIIAAYGLLQAYGVEIALSKEDEAAPFWKANTAIDAAYQVTRLDSYHNAEGMPVNSGDGMVLSVAYQNFSDQWFNDATAAAMIYVARSNEQRTQSTAKPYPKKSATPAISVQASLLK